MNSFLKGYFNSNLGGTLSFILEIVPSLSAPANSLQFSPSGGDFALANALTTSPELPGEQLFTDFRLAFDHADASGKIFYSPEAGADQLFVRDALLGQPGDVAYQATIIGPSILFSLGGDRFSLSVPLLGTIGPSVPGSTTYPVSLVYTFDLTKPAGFQTESGFIVYGDPIPGRGGPPGGESGGAGPRLPRRGRRAA